MGDGGDFLPRVVIEFSENTGTVQINFGMTSLGYDDLPDGAKKLFEIMDDWTAYCIASIGHMPYMSSVGYYITDRQIREKLVDYLQKEAVAYEHDEKEIPGTEKKSERYSFVIHEDDVARVAGELSTTTHLMKAATSIQRSNLGALVAEFDHLMFRMLKAICIDHPELIMPDEEAVPVGFLRSGGTLEAWQADQIERKIINRLHESHDDVVAWILTDIAKLKDLSSVKSSPFYRDFLEVCQRRHIFIHNGGVVNKEYIRKCVVAGFEESTLPKEGEVIYSDFGYLKSSAARVYLVGAFVLNLAFQKLYPKNVSVSFRSLLSASHDFLIADLTKMSERLIEFAENQSSKFDNDLKLKFAVNKALAKLFAPGVPEAEQTKNAAAVLSKYDWSVTTPVFDLALACIRRDFSNILDLARKANESGLSYQDASHFCVFKEARKVEGFMDCFPKAALMIAQQKVAE